MTTPSSITQPLIEVRGLTCERGERTLFTGMSFTVAPGSLVRIAGSNGAGKTTLLRLLTGLMRPAEGEIFWRGEPILKAAQDFWRELCYIGHRNGVKDDLSVMENVLINARIASLRSIGSRGPLRLRRRSCRPALAGTAQTRCAGASLAFRICAALDSG